MATVAAVAIAVAVAHTLIAMQAMKQQSTPSLPAVAMVLSVVRLYGLSRICSTRKKRETSSASSSRPIDCSAGMSSTKPVSTSLRSSSTGSHST